MVAPYFDTFGARPWVFISKPVLGPAPSADLRDRLLAELNNLGSADDAAMWAHRSPGEKNRLKALDAQGVEEPFQARLIALAAASASDPPQAQEVAPSALQEQKVGEPDRLMTRGRSKLIDKSVLALPKPRRVRDRGHAKICGQAFLSDWRPTTFGRPPSSVHATLVPLGAR